MKYTWRVDGDFCLTALLDDGKEWTFSRPGKHYIYCDFGSLQKHGTLGTQICYGGGTRGSTIAVSSQEEFAKEVKIWMSAYTRSIFK